MCADYGIQMEQGEKRPEKRGAIENMLFWRVCTQCMYVYTRKYLRLNLADLSRPNPTRPDPPPHTSAL